MFNVGTLTDSKLKVRRIDVTFLQAARVDKAKAQFIRHAVREAGGRYWAQISLTADEQKVQDRVGGQVIIRNSSLRKAKLKDLCTRVR